MAERPKISVKTNAPQRDPRRRPVRGGMAPLPPRDPEVAAPRGRPATPPRQGARPPAPGPAVRPEQPVREDRPQRPQRLERQERPAPPVRSDRPAQPPARPARPDRSDRPARPPLRPDRPARPGPEARPPAPRSDRATPEPRAEGVRLSKILSDRGQASRREADDWISAGWVRVNGRIAVLGQRVHGDERIDVDPAARKEQLRRVTILVHKPIGYVSGQAEDGYEPAVVLVKPENRWEEDRGLPWHPAHGRGLAPAGRLDIDSAGLLVLTQDGRIARHLIGEDSDVEKEYLVRVEPMAEGSFNPDDIERLRHGLELDGRQLKPAKVSWANEDQLRFVLREGRKRQVRRMCELVGLKVLGLKRVRIGSVVLGKLPVGQWRYLRDDERF